MIITLIILATIICGLLYRAGGSGNYPRYSREAGCAIVFFLCSWVLFGFSWWLFVAGCLLVGAVSTYWKKKGTDAQWYNWLFTGLGYSLAAFPIAIYTGHWSGFFIRTIVLSGIIVGWSEWMNNVVWEECGRGASIILTLPLLLI